MPALFSDVGPFDALTDRWLIEALSQLSSNPRGRGSGAAWLAQCGMVALLVVEESSATRDENITVQSVATLAQEPADPTPDREPEEALLIRLSAQKLWAEGRANPVWFECRSWIGDW